VHASELFTRADIEFAARKAAQRAFEREYFEGRTAEPGRRISWPRSPTRSRLLPGRWSRASTTKLGSLRAFERSWRGSGSRKMGRSAPSPQPAAGPRPHRAADEVRHFFEAPIADPCQPRAWSARVLVTVTRTIESADLQAVRNRFGHAFAGLCVATCAPVSP
jgi:hypothetical protein